MKVSIIIPIYNMEKSISKSVESILKQTYQDIEVILVDDGSKDNSFSVCKKMEEKNKVIKAYHTENRGSGPARNYGISKATGNFAYFPDADDYLEPEAIEIMVKAAKENNCDLVVFGYRFINTHGHITKEVQHSQSCFTGEEVRVHYNDFYYMDRQYGIQGAPWNKFFNLEIIKDKKIEFPDLRRHQDEVFISRYVTHSQNICFINDILYNYYTNDLKKEWMKYPITYIDIVEQLRKYRIEIIMRWNNDNEAMRNIIQNEYICNYIKAMELSFNRKYKFTYNTRIDWIRKHAENKEFNDLISNVDLPNNYIYQKKVIEYIKKCQYKKLYLLLQIKAFVYLNFSWMVRRQ